MKSLAIELTKGSQRQFQSVGWKTPKQGDCRRQFYALDHEGKALAVALKPAMAGFWIPGYSAVFKDEPFPEAVCVEISPCRLLPPPCYESQEEVDNQLAGHRIMGSWRWFYWQTHKQVLILEPSDDGPLQVRLDEWLVVMRAAYEKEVGVWNERIEQVRISPLGELKIETEGKRAKKLAELKEQLDIVESENPIEGVPCKGWLTLTLDDVKRGVAGIRDHWMVEDWATKNKVDLEQMARERLVFLKWLETHTGTPSNTFDASSRQSRPGISPPHIGERAENNPQFLEACAKVRYRARFADNAGSVVYLADCELNEEPTVPELDEIARLRGTADPKGMELAAEAQRMLSGGLMLNVGPLVEKMAPDEKLLFNWLVAKNHKRSGWALSYREIGDRLSVSGTEVQRRRQALEGHYGRDIVRFIAEAREKNDKGMNPDQCDSGQKVKTINHSPDAKAD